MTERWPELPYEGWRDTLDTLHMYTQVLGKLRLALSPFEPVWANVPLYVTARGLSTSPLPHGLAELDLIDHVLVLRSTDGSVQRRPVGGPVADFYRDTMSALRSIDVDVEISTVPQEVPDPVPFPDDRAHDTYDRAAASRFHRTLAMIDLVTKAHRAQFNGWSTPVHFFWGSFDLALVRLSGRRASPPAGAAFLQRYGDTHEMVCRLVAG